MDNNNGEKLCDCSISHQRADCKLDHTQSRAEHARNLSEATRYLLNEGGDIVLPRRVRTPSRPRNPEDPVLEFMDPPIHRRETSRDGNFSYRGELPFRPYENSSKTEEEIISSIVDRIRNEVSEKVRDHIPSGLRHIDGREYGTASCDLVEDSEMRASRREPKSKFDELMLGKMSMKEVAIGGFKVDLEEVARAANEILPLPPAKLPDLFKDKNLNFYHNVVNGLWEIIPFEMFMDIINCDPNDDNLDDILVEMISHSINIGYEKSDSESMLLIKKILQSTFESNSTIDRRSRASVTNLRVRANTWGFPYLSQGMDCHEVDLRMWLKSCYREYETLWSSAFKSTRAPPFARRVLSDRRSSSSSSKSTLRSIGESVNEGEGSIADLMRRDRTGGSEASFGGESRRRRHRQKQAKQSSMSKWLYT